MEKIIILGQGGHAKSLVDIIEREQKYKIAGYIVNNVKTESGSRSINDLEKKSGHCHVIGCDDDLEEIFHGGITRAAIGIGYMGKSDLREKLWKRLKDIGFSLPVICDPSAVISNHARIEEGCFIGKGAIINSGASIGKMCIINSGAIVEHDCVVEDFSHISVGSVLCGGVKVGKAAFIGANATVIQYRSIGSNCIIGAGMVVRKDIENTENKIRDRVQING